MNSRRQVEYCGDLALLLRHGVPLAAAVDLVAGEAGAGSSEALIAVMVKSGEPLGQAMEKADYPMWARAAVAAAEAAGSPSEGLEMIAAQLEREDAWRDRVTRVTSYPLLVLGSTILTGVILFRVVLPTVSALSEELGSAPPLATRVALWIGRAGGSAVVWLVAAAVLGLTVWSVSNHERLRTISSRIPGLAETVRLAEAWRYFGVLSILSRASIPLDRALEIAAVVVAPDDWREAATELARRVKAGDAPGAASRRAQWLPSRTSRVLGLAEVSGTMPQAFAALAGHAEVLLARRLERLTRWMPVVLLAFAAMLIGFLAQAMLMPAFQIDLPT